MPERLFRAHDITRLLANVERRADERFPYLRQTNLRSRETAHHVRLHDVSCFGARLRLAVELRARQRLTLEVPVPQRCDGGICRYPIETEVVWQRSNEVGLRFIEPPGALKRALDWYLERFLVLASASERQAYIERLLAQQRYKTLELRGN